MRTIRSVMQGRLFDRQIPVWLSWPITNRCNYRCSYCGRPDHNDGEIPTRRALEIVDEFADLGTRYVFLSGGEPLVRADLPVIIERCRQRRLFICLTTNGALYLQRKKDIGRINMLKLSLDGPESVHDRYRASGAYAKVIQVLEDASRDQLPVILNAVVSTASLPYLEDLVALAKRYKAIIKFQPINTIQAGNRNIENLMLSGEQHRFLSARLRKLKFRTGVIGNTLAGIDTIGRLPAGGDMVCYARRIFVYLTSDGSLFPCSKRNEIAEPQSCAGTPVARALKNVPRVSCRTCFCTSDAELNLLMRFRPRDILSILPQAMARGV